MFHDLEIRWLATVDPPGGAVDRYVESMQLHRLYLGSMYPRAQSHRENLNCFATYWESTDSADVVIVIVSDASPEGVLDVESLADALPDGARLLCLLRRYRSVLHPNVHVVGVPADTDADFEKKVGAHIARLVALQGIGTRLNPLKPTFPERRLEVHGPSVNVPVDVPCTVSWSLDGIRYDFFSSLQAGSGSLVVIGQSALVRERVTLPVFQRWTWAEDLRNCSTIVLNDPNLYLDPDLNAGWWFGTPERDTAREMAGLVGDVAQQLGIPRRQVVFYGGSAGGFSSFHMAACLPGSRVVVDIPQIDMRAYHHVMEANLAARVAFGVSTIAETPASLLHRVDVVERFCKEETIPEYLYLQNSRDASHVSAHYGYFMERTADLASRYEWAQRKGAVELYSFWNVHRGGHFPMNREDTTDRINTFLSTHVVPGAPRGHH